jgi:hypothetical protein
MVFFYLKIYENNIFIFLKIIFDISTLKRFKNIKKLISSKKNKLQNTILTAKAKTNRFLI